MTNPNSKSFILHKDSLFVLNEMTNEQAGKFIKAIFEYQVSGKLPPLDFGLKMAISPFVNQFKRDQEKYQNIVERNKNNGSKGGRPKNQKKPTGLFGNPEKPKKADNKNDSDNKNDNKKLINENKNIILPDFIKADLWSEFLAMRKKLKAPNTEMALNRILKKLRVFEQQNIGNGTLAIENSIENGWKGVFEPKATRFNKNNSNDSFNAVFKEINLEQLKLK